MESTARLARAVTVHDAAEVALALEAAKDVLSPSLVLPLISPPAAANWMSARLFLAIITEGSARSAVPHLPVLHCGHSPGHALAALRAGCPGLVLSATCPAFPAVAGASAEAGAILWDSAPESLDLGGVRRDDPHAPARLRDWLRG